MSRPWRHRMQQLQGLGYNWASDPPACFIFVKPLTRAMAVNRSNLSMRNPWLLLLCPRGRVGWSAQTLCRKGNAAQMSSWLHPQLVTAPCLQPVTSACSQSSSAGQQMAAAFLTRAGCPVLISCRSLVVAVRGPVCAHAVALAGRERIHAPVVRVVLCQGCGRWAGDGGG